MTSLSSRISILLCCFLFFLLLWFGKRMEPPNRDLPPALPEDNESLKREMKNRFDKIPESKARRTKRWGPRLPLLLPGVFQDSRHTREQNIRFGHPWPEGRMLAFEDLVIEKNVYEKGMPDEIEEFIYRLSDVTGDGILDSNYFEKIGKQYPPQATGPIDRPL